MSKKNYEFSKRLKLLVDYARIKKKTLANDVDVSPSAIGTYINSGRVPEAPILMNIAQSLNTSPEWLIEGKGWTIFSATSEDSIKYANMFLRDTVRTVIIVSYRDNPYIERQGFLFIDDDGTVVALNGGGTTSGFDGEGPRAYESILELIKMKSLSVGIIQLDEKESSNIERINFADIIDRATYSDEVIDSELSRIRFAFERELTSSMTQNAASSKNVDYIPNTETVLIPTNLRAIIDAVIEVMTSEDEDTKLALLQNAFTFQKTVRNGKEIAELKADMEIIKKRLLGAADTDFKTLEAPGASEHPGEKHRAGGKR